MSIAASLRYLASAVTDQSSVDVMVALQVWEKASDESLLAQLESSPGLRAMCYQHLDEEWAAIAEPHLRACQHIGRGDPVKAFTSHKASLQAFYSVFNATEGTWLLLAFNQLNLTLRQIAERAHPIQAAASGQGEALSQCVDLFRRALSLCLSDRTKDLRYSKKQSSLHIVNHLLKIAFGLNNLQLCQAFRKNAEGPTFPDIANFCLAEEVTFRYFRGRLCLLDGDFKMANSELTFAAKHCHCRARTNKRLILTYLVPVRMLGGQFPTDDLLARHGLTVYSDFSRALRSGDAELFDRTLTRHQRALMKRGLYLLMQKAKLLCYRNLLRKVVRIVVEANGKNIINLSDVSKALALAKVDMDSDEVECMVANLIYRGMVRGYISHQHKKMRLSDKEPFPTTNPQSPHLYL